jgi:hypothetical protein
LFSIYENHLDVTICFEKLQKLLHIFDFEIDTSLQISTLLGFNATISTPHNQVVFVTKNTAGGCFFATKWGGVSIKMGHGVILHFP